MESTLWKQTLLAAGLLTAGLTAQTAPLQRGDVAAEPAWLVHVDCDRLRPTVVGQYLLAELDKPEAQARLGAFQAIFNLDPRKQLHGLTLYSASEDAADGVALVYADTDPERLVTLAKGATDYQSTKHKDHVIHNWIDDKRTGHDGDGARTYAAIHSAHLVVFGQHKAPVAAALDVLDRTAPNLSTGKAFPQMGASGNTSFLQAAARKLDIPSSEPNAALLRLSKVAHLQIGEAQKQVTATLSVEANDEEVAKQMASVGQGLVGLLKLQQEKPQSVKLAEAISLKQDGAGVVATLAMPADDVVELMKAGAPKKAEKRAEKD
jgi:hypothetical protein